MTDRSSRPFSEARIAGLSPIPVDTTTKRPLVRWAPFQDSPANDDEILAWDTAGHNIGVVCGHVSGRLMCLDFEGAFMDRAIFLETNVHELLAIWRRGYCESTPSGGFHILVRVEGEGPCDGNTKLASAPDGKTLIETRGEGGYVITAPSRNGHKGWELVRGGFESIEMATLAEWATVVAGLAQLDESPAPPMVSTPTSTVSPSILRLGDSWIEAALESLPTVERTLADLGWVPARTRDSYGQHWVRPGKDPREGHSASISETGRLYVHSSNAGLPVGNPTLDRLDVILCGICGMGTQRPSLDDRTDYLRNWWRDLKDFTDRMLDPGLPAPPAEREQAAAGAPVAATSLNLPDDFWAATELLSQIRDASIERMVSPDAVFGALLAQYAATVPMSIWMPGPPRRAPLNVFSCLVGDSGTGKTAAMGVAADLLGWSVSTNPHVLLGRSLRSGEGLPRLAIVPAKRKRGEEEIEQSPAYRNAVQITFDEGGALGKQAERLGSTTIPYLNTAWAGSGMVGGAKADEIGEFPAELVRVCAIIGVQYGAAANLFTGEAQVLGFPQRLLYFNLRHPQLGAFDVDKMVSEPAQSLRLPYWPHAEFSGRPWFLEVDPVAERESRLWLREKDHGSGIDDPLDGHLMNLRRRTAAVLGLMHGEMGVSSHFWDLSNPVIEASRATRTRLRTSLGEVSKQRTRARIEEAVATADALDSRKIAALARRVATYVQRRGPSSMKQLKDGCFKHDERPLREEVLAFAELRGWVIHRDGRYESGDSQPR